MNQSKKLLLPVLAFIGLYTTTLSAQQKFIASGAEISGAGGKISQSVGQLFYTTASGSGGTLVQGIHQPIVIIDPENGIETKWIDLTTAIFPNPSSGMVTLSVKSDPANISYCIIGADGKLLYQSEDLTSADTGIDLRTYPNGTYFIKVLRATAELKSFKLIKNN